ncbi:uncharacterized protein LOC108738361 [Agrilus planipennis]|uniref:Uncharacterized protein LOC108738361 n=1 Tax=Agrilus planipennis TaxID=224129 RepID=A0A7F5QYT6_AGRPL|nr:uncharacterized protein LOC108738361 [Agrilus planipennis]
MSNFLTVFQINWHFTPPLSPHFGGLWESTVKLFKHHMIRVVSDLLFTFEELNTFVIEVEAILNSRLITPISNDPNDPAPLTPGHFLIGDSLTSLPEADICSISSNRLSHWQHIQKVRQHFWNRWYKEYLNELNIHHKWTAGKPTVQENAIVLLKEETVPPVQWILGRIIKTYPGADGIIRTVTVKTAKSVKNLALLPIPENYLKNKEP